MRRELPVWFWLAVLLPAALSLLSISRRHSVEARNQAVGLAVEYDTVSTLAAVQGISLDLAFRNLKEQGVSAVSLTEDNIADRIQRGEIQIVSRVEPKSPTDVWLQDVALFCRTPELAGLVDRAIRARYKPDTGELDSPIAPATLAQARGVSIGLDPAQVLAVRQAEMDLIARLANPAGGTREYLDFQLDQLSSQNATYFLPLGDQVLGRRGLQAEFLEGLQDLELTYLTAEFGKIAGDANVVAAAGDRTLRLHTAQSAELDRLTRADAVERFAKAARERNVRMLLIRPLSNSEEQPLTEFAGFVKDINTQIRKVGGAIGTPRPFQGADLPNWLNLAIGLSLIPATVLAAGMVHPRLSFYGLLAGLLVGALAFVSSGREIAALFGSMLFPFLAYVWLEAVRPRSVLLGFLAVSAISLVGGLVVAGLLNGLPYMLKAEEFRGIKISVFLPIALVGLYLFARTGSLKDALRAPITWGSSAMALGLAGVVLFMLSRTGNDNPAGVSGIELAFRSLLDETLFVRPRTKEFLIGHPALLVGIGMLARTRLPDFQPRPGYLGWTALVLMVGAIGSTSLVNTLCHLHTPVQLSIIRIGIGLAVGCILGLVVHLAVQRALKADA